MTLLQAICFVFLTGLTVCGLAGSAMELATGKPLSFREPYLSTRTIFRSLAFVASAGPLMLGNDTLAAWRDRDLSAFSLLSCALTAFAWTLAIGMLTIDLASRVAALLF